jgi:NADPH:quinone reductase-like Zn-dependent oxidoreductase
MGARPIVIARDGDRAARVAALGATAIAASVGPAWEARLLPHTGRRGVDGFVDVVGGAELAREVAATRVGGSISLVGFAAGASATLDLTAVIPRMITLRAVSAGNRTALEGLVRALDATPIRPVIDRVFPFDRARDAIAYQETGRPFGKVVIEVAGD